MIDIENKVFDTVYNAVTAQHPDCTVLGEYVETVASFPAVQITMTDLEDYRRTATINPENHAITTFEINVYSDKQEGAKSECKSIMATCDDAMHGMNFRRLMMRRVPAVDRTIYRIYARYEAVVAKSVEINGDTVFQINRR